MDANEQPPAAPAATPDAPDQETMEQIRRRRLAKLGGPSPASGASPKPESESAATPTKAPERASDKGKGKAVSPEPRPKINITPTPQQSSAAVTPPYRKQTPSQEPVADFTDRVLRNIFLVTVDPNVKTDTEGKNKLTFLPNLSQELADDGAPLKLSIDRLEEAIMESATAYPPDKPLLNYLLPCWKRTIKHLKQNRDPKKEELYKEAKRLCFANCIFALSMPELFSREPNAQHDTLAPYLLKEVEHESGLDMDFFVEAVKRITEDEDDTILPLFTKAMVEVSARLAKISMNDDYKPCVNALLTYSRFPVLLNALAQHPQFQMAVSTAAIEKQTILGPFFRISPLQPEVTMVYFSGPRTMDKGRIQTSQSALQMTLGAHQNDLRTIINAFVRAGPQAKFKALDWFAYIMNTNHKRRAIQVDPAEVSSDGFMMNVTVVLDCLCEPFMDNTFSKIDRIDIKYFRRSPRLDIKDETKLNADQSRSDAFYANNVDKEPNNFITEIFFLTLAAHHYGSEATNSKIKSMDKDIKYLEKNIGLIEAERVKMANSPDQLRRLDVALQRHIAVLEKSIAMKYSIEGVLLDTKMQSRSLLFMKYVTIWLLRVASQSDYKPGQALRLPLPANQPEELSCLPEYALQDIVDNFKFVFRHIPQIIVSAVGDETIALCIAFLESSEYVKNPYLKSSLVSLLFHGTWPTYHLKKGVLGDIMTSTRFANDYLLHALMKFYIECESTGVSTQFYDKFNIRYEIFQVIKCIWSNPLYSRQLTQSSKTNRPFFIRFVNLLTNDATYVLDEGLGKFPKIHELQQKLRDPTLSQEDRGKIEEELRTAEGQATSFMQLVNETVSMMCLFTSTLGEAFTMPEIVHRLAGMLDYNLEILTGPKSRTLKVDNPEKYYFNPKALLPEIVDIYLNLGSSPAFVEAVASDGRSYKPQTMEATRMILNSKHLKNPDEILAWDALCKKFETTKQALDEAEADYDDAPPEFEDELMGILMSDPVILPSKHILDRSTIVQHLLSDPKDPYTRQPMTIDDVVPDDELRQRIEKWKEERRGAARLAREAAAAEKMDTTE